MVSTNGSIISVHNVTRVFGIGQQAVTAVNDANLTVNTGEFLTIMGRSGSGKTTLLNLMAGLDQPTSGTLMFEGRDLATLNEADQVQLRRHKISFIFQSFGLIPLLSAYENVELPLTYRGMPSAERKTRVNDALEKVGMAHRMKHFPSQLSGGQQQRVAVARAVVGEPSLLLADEPTGNLDSTNGKAVMDLMRELHDGGATICMVTHDPRYAEYAERNISLFDGRIVEDKVEA